MKIYEKKNYYAKGEYESYTHKHCTHCGELKEIKEFGKNVVEKSRLGWAYRSWCWTCNKLSCSNYGKTHREIRNATLRKCRKRNPEKFRMHDLRGRLKMKYGITLEQRDEMILNQEGRCKICGKKTSKLVIDHDHVTGKVRGMLCHGCNTMLGKYETYRSMIDKFNKYLDEN
jgi:hypothetical protein